MPKGFCKCGYLLVDGKCPKCGSEESKKVLTIHLNSGRKEILVVNDAQLLDFISFMESTRALHSFEKDTIVKVETLYISRQSVSCFGVSEVAK